MKYPTLSILLQDRTLSIHGVRWSLCRNGFREAHSSLCPDTEVWPEACTAQVTLLWDPWQKCVQHLHSARPRPYYFCIIFTFSTELWSACLCFCAHLQVATPCFPNIAFKCPFCFILFGFIFSNTPLECQPGSNYVFISCSWRLLSGQPIIISLQEYFWVPAMGQNCVGLHWNKASNVLPSSFLRRHPQSDWV